MGRTAQPTTCDQFARMVDSATTCELVRGEVVELSRAGLDHSRSSANIAVALGSWARSTMRGRIFTNEVGLITERDPDTLRGADVVYYSCERLPKGDAAGFSAIPPDVVVDVWGRWQTWTDLHEQAAEYLRMGVDRVWLVDPEGRSIHVLGRELPPARFGPDDVLGDAEILPGLELHVAALFAD